MAGHESYFGNELGHAFRQTEYGKLLEPLHAPSNQGLVQSYMELEGCKLAYYIAKRDLQKGLRLEPVC